MNEVKVIPFSPLPLEQLRRVSKPFTGIGLMLGNALPYLSLQLEQAGINATKKEYSAIMVFLTLSYFVFFSILSFFVFSKLLANESMQTILSFSLTLSLVFAFLVLVQVSMFPSILIKKNVRDVERNLVFALRTMLVQLKSGVPLFQCLNMISFGDYGKLSFEFKKAIEEINTGSSEQLALQKLATKNPSPFLRKALWQIVNGMKAGADVSSVLEVTVSSMIKQQSIEINNFSAKLRLLSLFYMMIGVIIPALGITFLIVLGSFPQIKLSEELFWFFLGGIILFEFMFIGMIKSVRPNLLSG